MHGRRSTTTYIPTCMHAKAELGSHVKFRAATFVRVVGAPAPGPTCAPPPRLQCGGACAEAKSRSIWPCATAPAVHGAGGALQPPAGDDQREPAGGDERRDGVGRHAVRDLQVLVGEDRRGEDRIRLDRKCRGPAPAVEGQASAGGGGSKESPLRLYSWPHDGGGQALQSVRRRARLL